MPEQEELRLVVTLDDQASAGLAKLRERLADHDEEGRKWADAFWLTFGKMCDLSKSMGPKDADVGWSNPVTHRSFLSLQVLANPAL
jgi:hypothetical protein